MSRRGMVRPWDQSTFPSSVPRTPSPSGCPERAEAGYVAGCPGVLVDRDGTWWIYHEATRADGANELRLARAPTRAA